MGIFKSDCFSKSFLGVWGGAGKGEDWLAIILTKYKNENNKNKCSIRIFTTKNARFLLRRDMNSEGNWTKAPTTRRWWQVSYNTRKGLILNYNK